jgi:hypothetical protein
MSVGMGGCTGKLIQAMDSGLSFTNRKAPNTNTHSHTHGDRSCSVTEAAMVTRKDRQQDQRLDDAEDANADQDQRLGDLEDEVTDQADKDAEQDASLAAVQHSTQGVNAELPGINTPQGAQQRLKLFAPTPLTLVTLGAIGNNDAGQHPVGPSGFSLKTVQNFAAEVQQSTIIDTDHHVIIHTPEDMTTVAGQKLFFSTNGDYKLGTVGDMSMTAAAGAGFADPAFTVDPQMAVPAPPAIDIKGPRASTESTKGVWSAIWTAYDAYSGISSLKDVIAQRSLAKGLAKDTFAGKAAGLYSVLNNLKKVIDGALAAGAAAVAAFDHSSPSEPAWAPGKPKITMYADQGVTIMSPEKVSIFSTTGGVGIDSPHKVGMKGGVSASIKAGCDATVFAFVSAKLESKLVAAVKGKVVSISGDLVEMKAAQTMDVSSKGALDVVADVSLRLSSKAKGELSANDLAINSDSFIRMACDDVIELHASNQNNLWGDKKVFIQSNELVEVKCKNSSFSCKENEFKFGCDEKVGVRATNSQANIGTQQTYTIYKDSGFRMHGAGASKITAPNISIG